MRETQNQQSLLSVLKDVSAEVEVLSDGGEFQRQIS